MEREKDATSSKLATGIELLRGQSMEGEEDSSPNQSLQNPPDLDKLLCFETGLKAPRWHARVEAAQLAARTLANYSFSRFISKKDVSGGAISVVDVYDKILRQLVHGLALQDAQWPVRGAAIESAATILAAAKYLLPVDLFAEYVWGILAACLDLQPEVQLAASTCVLQQLLPSASHERQTVITQLCDRFVVVALGVHAIPLKFARISTKSEVTGLDSLLDGEALLAGTTAVIILQLLPTLDSLNGQAKQEYDRIPLLVVVATLALEDANRRQSRLIAGGLSKLLRCLGAPCYRQSLAVMFNPKAPVYVHGSSLARMYQNAGIIDEDTAEVLKTVKIVTILKGLSVAFEAPHADKFWTNVIRRDDLFVPHPSEVSGISQDELIALQQIAEMLVVPADLTRTLKDQENELRAAEFIESAVSLLSISTSIIKSLSSVPQDISKKLVEDLVLCCAAFCGGDGEYGVAVRWTSKGLCELSMTLLSLLSDTLNANGGPRLSGNGESNYPPTKRLSIFISEHIHTLLPRIKQVIQASVISGSEVFSKQSLAGSVDSSIIAAYQMQWILRQLEHPHLGPHCQLVMPCVLTALDHFSPEVKRQAMRTSFHLAQNMNPTELRWYKDVLLDAVSRSLVGCGDLWPVAVKMAVTTVTRIEGRNPRGSWYGRIFGEMLGELERHRDDQGQRIIWLQEISPYLEAMGLVLVAHYKRLLPLLFHWLHAPDDMTCALVHRA